jgi:parallel beta-helix repeat protein
MVNADAPSFVVPTAPTLTCTVQVTTSENLSTVVANAPAGSVFCLAAGVYPLIAPVIPKNGDSFVGSSTDQSVINAMDSGIGINVHNATGVTIETLTIENAQYSAGTNDSGRGVNEGPNLAVYSSYFSGNAQSGIDGGAPNVLVVNSEFVGNGSTALLEDDSSGLKMSQYGSVYDSTFEDNIGQGIWCDVGCVGGTWTVEGNTVTGNTVGGIRYEISSAGALIEGNTVTGNNTADQSGNGGIQVNSSANATVEDNLASGNGLADIIVNGDRLPGVSNDLVADNTGAPKIIGCSLVGVVCEANATPTLTTTPSPTTVTLGPTSTTLTDTAVLSGGSNPTGTITFTLYYGSTLVDTETVTANGNGTYTTPTGYTLPTTGTVTGTYQWDASYSGDTNNGAISDNNATNEQVIVGKGFQTITFTAPVSGFVGGSATLSATGGASGNPVVFTVDPSTLSGVCNVTGTNGTTLHYTGAGTCVIDANQAGNTTYAAAATVTGSTSVRTGSKSQTITFGTLANKTLVQSPVTVSATASSRLAVTFITTTPTVCTTGGTNGAKITLLKVGTCTVQANQGGNATYSAAKSVNRSFTVSKASQTITF